MTEVTNRALTICVVEGTFVRVIAVLYYFCITSAPQSGGGDKSIVSWQLDQVSIRSVNSPTSR